MLKSKATRVTAQLGAVIVFTVTLASHVLAQNLSVTLLQKGTSGTLVGAANIQVARHNPATGVFVAALTTDSNGLADFGNIGSARTTISIIFPDSIEGLLTFKDTVALVNVPTGNIKFRVDDEELDNEVSEPILATFNVALTNVPGNTSTSMNLSGGNYFDGGPAGQFNTITVGPRNLDAAGKFNIVAEAKDATSILACGSGLALDPASVNGTTVIISLNAAPIQIPFNTTPSTQVRVGHNVEFLRDGVAIEGGHGHSGSEVFHASGNLIACPVAGFGKVKIKARNASDSAPAQKETSRTFTTLPAAINFAIPDRTIDTLSRSGGTVHWTASGTAATDGTFIDLEWASGANRLSWSVVTDPSVASMTLPTLPVTFSDRNAVPSSGVAVSLHQFGFDSVAGFDAFVAAVSAADGSFDTLFFNATDSFVVSRTLSPKAIDFDGDGKSDVGIYRDGVWAILRSSDNGLTVDSLGGPTDTPVPADYDGDGKNDIAVYLNGLWTIKRSSDGVTTSVGFGGPSFAPVPADYDGDGKADIAVYSGGVWSILRSSDGGNTVIAHGGPGWTPVPADYDGDGKTDIAVYINGAWSIIRSSDSGNTVVGHGGPTWTPLPADYDGDGKADIAVYTVGAWSILRSSDGGNTVVGHGGPTWEPVPADYDGDGKTDISVHMSGAWSIVKSSTSSIQVVGHGGGPTDIPLN